MVFAVNAGNASLIAPKPACRIDAGRNQAAAGSNFQADDG
jgi:hypothetical protein